jgi:hypothetical protein
MQWIAAIINSTFNFHPKLSSHICTTKGYKTKTTEMKIISCIPGYSFLHHRRNNYILEELNMDPIKEKLAQYKQN